MQTATYNIIDKTPVILWRALPVQITITGIKDITGDWVFLLDKDWVDGAIITGEITKDNNNIIVTIDMLDNNYIASAISGKPVLQCKGTLTDGQNQCYLIPINIQNRTVNTAPAPTPATSYYTKQQTDDKFTTKTQLNNLSLTVNDDIANLANNYWTKQEVAQAIANVQTMEIVVVQQLPPVAEAKEYTIYLAPTTQSEEGNYYDEYLLINGAFEKIGSTDIDVSGFATLAGNNVFTGTMSIKSQGISLGTGEGAGRTATTFSQGHEIGSTSWNRLGESSFSPNIGEARGKNSFACNSAIAVGERASAFGISSSASGLASFSQGRNCAAGHQYSHAEGAYVSTGENNQHAEGKYNIATTGAHVIGGGTSEQDRKNIEVLDWDGNLWIAGNLSTAGKQNITLNSLTALAPKDNKIYRFALSADATLSFDSTALTASNTVDFELHLTQGSTAYNVTWPNNVLWGENGVFKASNTSPAINESNMEYSFSVRWDGSNLLINLAYSKEITE